MPANAVLISGNVLKRCRIQQSSDLSQASAICASAFLQEDDEILTKAIKKRGPFLKATMGC